MTEFNPLAAPFPRREAPFPPAPTHKPESRCAGLLFFFLSAVEGSGLPRKVVNSLGLAVASEFCSSQLRREANSSSNALPPPGRPAVEGR